MELAFLVYGLGFLYKFQVALLLFLIGSAAGSFMYFGFSNIENQQTIVNLRKDSDKYRDTVANIIHNNLIAKRLFIIAVTCLGLVTILPSERTAYMMVGAYAVQTVASHPSTAETSAKVLKLINIKLDEFIK